MSAPNLWREIDEMRADARAVDRAIEESKGWTLIEPIAGRYRARKRFRDLDKPTIVSGRNASELSEAISGADLAAEQRAADRAAGKVVPR